MVVDFKNMQKILLLLLIVVSSNAAHAHSALECQQRSDEQWEEFRDQYVKESDAQELQAQQEFKTLMAQQKKEALSSVMIAARLFPQLCIISLHEQWCNFWKKR